MLAFTKRVLLRILLEQLSFSEIFLVPDPCIPSPCLHNGTCLNTGDTFQCHCPSAFSGKRCERMLSWTLFKAKISFVHYVCVFCLLTAVFIFRFKFAQSAGWNWSRFLQDIYLINQARGPYWENIGPRSWQYEGRPTTDILPVRSRASLVNKRFIIWLKQALKF